MKKKAIYKLVKKDLPVIKKNKLEYDPGVGGEKLVYERVSYEAYVFNLLGIIIHIPLLVTRDISTIVYYRPFKKNWANKKEKLPFHLWGKKEHPLTNIWLEMLADYTDIKQSLPIIKTRIEDQELIKLLRQHKEKFTLYN